MVDDNPLDLTMLRFLTTGTTCVVIESTSVAEATKAIESENFDLVLTDFELPDGTGLQLLNTLRKKSGDTLVWCVSASIGANENKQIHKSFDRVYRKHQDFQKLQADFGAILHQLSRA